MYKINGLIGKKIAINCDSKEKASKFLERCFKSGLSYRSGRKIDSKNAEWYYKEDTCYSLYKPTDLGTVSYGSKSNYNQQGFSIIDSDEVEI